MVMQPTRRTLLAGFTTFGTAALAACGAGGGGGAGGTTDTTKSKQPVSLTFESYASGGQAGGQINEFDNWKQALDRAHQKYPWITVDATFVGSLTPGSYDRWTAAMAAGTAPSIMEFETKRMPSFAEKGTLLDLTPYTAKSRVAAKADFLETDWEKTIYKGKQWMMVTMSKPAVFFYNTELFKKTGVPEPSTKWGDPAWSWDSFVQVCKKLTTQPGPNAVYGFHTSTWWVYLQPFLWSNGGDFLNKDRTGGAVDQPAAIEAAQKMQDLGLKERVMPLAPNSPEGSPSFQNGRIAIYHVNSGNWLGYGQVPDLKWNIAPIPTGKAGTIARNPPNGWAAYAGEKHPDDTWLAVEELVQPDSLRNIEGVPDRKKQAEDGDFAAAKYLQTIGGKWQVFIDAKKNSRDEPATQYFQDLDKTISASQNAYWNGQMSVKEWASKLKDKIDAVQKGQGPQDW